MRQLRQIQPLRGAQSAWHSDRCAIEEVRGRAGRRGRCRPTDPAASRRRVFRKH